MRLLLPQLDREREAYGIKEVRSLINMNKLNVGVDCSKLTKNG